MKLMDLITENRLLWELLRMMPKLRAIGNNTSVSNNTTEVDSSIIHDSTLNQSQDTINSSNKADKIIVVDASTLPSTLDPNKVYSFGTLTGSVTIPAFSSVAAEDTEAKIWCFTFNTSTTAPTITWPAGITAWSGGNAPTINASKSYEVSVMDGIGVIIET